MVRQKYEQILGDNEDKLVELMKKTSKSIFTRIISNI